MTCFGCVATGISPLLSAPIAAIGNLVFFSVLRSKNFLNPGSVSFGDESANEFVPVFFISTKERTGDNEKN